MIADRFDYDTLSMPLLAETVASRRDADVDAVETELDQIDESFDIDEVIVERPF